MPVPRANSAVLIRYNLWPLSLRCWIFQREKWGGKPALRKWKAIFHLRSSMFCSSLALNRCFIYKPILFLIPDSVDVYLTVPALWQFLNHSLTEKVRKKKIRIFTQAHSLQSPVSLPSDSTVLRDKASAVLCSESDLTGNGFNRDGYIVKSTWNYTEVLETNVRKETKDILGNWWDTAVRDTAGCETLAKIERIKKRATGDKIIKWSKRCLFQHCVIIKQNIYIFFKKPSILTSSLWRTKMYSFNI